MKNILNKIYSYYKSLLKEGRVRSDGKPIYPIGYRAFWKYIESRFDIFVKKRKNRSRKSWLWHNLLSFYLGLIFVPIFNSLIMRIKSIFGKYFAFICVKLFLRPYKNGLFLNLYLIFLILLSIFLFIVIFFYYNIWMFFLYYENVDVRENSIKTFLFDQVKELPEGGCITFTEKQMVFLISKALNFSNSDKQTSLEFGLSSLIWECDWVFYSPNYLFFKVQDFYIRISRNYLYKHFKQSFILGSQEGKLRRSLISRYSFFNKHSNLGEDKFLALLNALCWNYNGGCYDNFLDDLNRNLSWHSKLLRHWKPKIKKFLSKDLPYFAKFKFYNERSRSFSGEDFFLRLSRYLIIGDMLDKNYEYNAIKNQQALFKKKKKMLKVFYNINFNPDNQLISIENFFDNIKNPRTVNLSDVPEINFKTKLKLIERKADLIGEQDYSISKPFELPLNKPAGNLVVATGFDEKVMEFYKLIRMGKQELKYSRKDRKNGDQVYIKSKRIYRLPKRLRRWKKYFFAFRDLPDTPEVFVKNFKYKPGNTNKTNMLTDKFIRKVDNFYIDPLTKIDKIYKDLDTDIYKKWKLKNEVEVFNKKFSFYFDLKSFLFKVGSSYVPNFIGDNKPKENENVKSIVPSYSDNFCRFDKETQALEKKKYNWYWYKYLQKKDEDYLANTVTIQQNKQEPKKTLGFANFPLKKVYWIDKQKMRSPHFFTLRDKSINFKKSEFVKFRSIKRKIKVPDWVIKKVRFKVNKNTNFINRQINDLKINSDFREGRSIFILKSIKQSLNFSNYCGLLEGRLKKTRTHYKKWIMPDPKKPYRLLSIKEDIGRIIGKKQSIQTKMLKERKLKMLRISAEANQFKLDKLYRKRIMTFKYAKTKKKELSIKRWYKFRYYKIKKHIKDKRKREPTILALSKPKLKKIKTTSCFIIRQENTDHLITLNKNSNLGIRPVIKKHKADLRFKQFFVRRIKTRGIWSSRRRKSRKRYKFYKLIYPIGRLKIKTTGFKSKFNAFFKNSSVFKNKI